MANSMDNIFVKFGISLSKDEHDLVLWGGDTEEECERGDKLRTKIKKATVPEFLALDPKTLNETEQQIQKALQVVYKLNEMNPPLFTQFPSFRSEIHPLTIDITNAGNTGKDREAVYNGFWNNIGFERVHHNVSDLVKSLVHELEHAFQTDKEVYYMADDLKHSNPLAIHEVEFFREAGAELKAAQALYKARKLGLIKDTTVDAEADTYKNLYDIVCADITPVERRDRYAAEIYFGMLLEDLFQSSYKEEYDKRWPLNPTDKGLDHIPESLHLPASFAKYLQKVPRSPVGQKGPQLEQYSKQTGNQQKVSGVHKRTSPNPILPNMQPDR